MSQTFEDESGTTRLRGTLKPPGVTLPITEADVTGLVADLASKQAVAGKDAANGYAGLDAGTQLASVQIPSGIARVHRETERVTGNAVNVAGGSQASLTWNTAAFGDALLNLAAPAAPALVAAGTYAVTVTVSPNASLAAGVVYRAFLTLNATGQTYIFEAGSPAAVAAWTMPAVTISAVLALDAGNTLVCQIENEGVLAVDFILRNASIQRLSAA